MSLENTINSIDINDPTIQKLSELSNKIIESIKTTGDGSEFSPLMLDRENPHLQEFLAFVQESQQNGSLDLEKMLQEIMESEMFEIQQVEELTDDKEQLQNT